MEIYENLRSTVTGISDASEKQFRAGVRGEMKKRWNFILSPLKYSANAHKSSAPVANHLLKTAAKSRKTFDSL
jgi:hypothetical protein